MKTDNLVLDGRHLLYRTSDAFSNLTTEVKGREIGCGGMYGFLTVALRVHKRYGGKVWVAWEGKRSDNFRIDLWPTYKQKAEPTDEEADFITDMVEQELRLKVMLRAMGVRQFEGVHCEADDVMAWIAHDRNEAGESVLIYTGDSDLRQLVRGGVSGKGVVVAAPGRRADDTVYDTAKKVQEKHGVYPRLLPDLKALAGDASDNIPGVKGIGPKTAVQLIDEYSNVRGVILAAAGKDGGRWPVAERFRQKIIDARRDILLFKKLTELTPDVEVKEISRRRSKDTLVKHFKMYKFRSLLTPNELMDLMRMGQ
ncbi:MAG: 5'-3' exonuclease [bacterium]